MPRDWQSLVEGMTWVQRMVHLAYRMGLPEQEAIRSELLTQRRSFYEDELTAQAARVGCPSRRGQVRSGPILSALNDMSAEDAASIVNTYNYDLAIAIINIYEETPTANRYVYAYRLRGWEAARSQWKDPQIALYTETSARSKAQQDFYQYNPALGMAVLHPEEAVCPVCQGWVARGEVTLREAESHPPPYHVNCLPPGQKVLMADGMERPIEDVEVGDEVATSRGSSRVKTVFRRPISERIVRLVVADRVLLLTGDHPVKTEHGWIAAQELKVGSRAVVAHCCEGFASVEMAEFVGYTGDVLNIETEAEEFIAGGIVVHNCPHLWETYPDRVPSDQCPLLWMGE